MFKEKYLPKIHWFLHFCLIVFCFVLVWIIIAYIIPKILPTADISNTSRFGFVFRNERWSGEIKIIGDIWKNLAQIDKTISKAAPQWPVEKIARIDRAILEIGVYEIAFTEDIPPVVAINESIEMAKHFGDDNSPKFVNGVLSSVMKEYKSNKK